ncbi:S1 family peptidase [Arthrobacter sp. RHLT1-20]
MSTPKFQLVMRGVAAVAVALAGSFCAVPALAEAGGAEPAPASPSPSEVSGPAETPPEPDSTPSAAPTAAATAAPTSPAAVAPEAPPAAAPAAPVVSDAGLAEAVRRDLGLTLEEFNAAGQLAKRAADAVPSLRVLPGYVGISLKDGRIAVEGSGAELRARIEQLNQAGPSADFVLVAPAAAVPGKVPSAADLVASSTEQLFQDYVREVGPAGLQAVAYADGRFTIRTGGTNMSEAGLPAILDPQLPPPTFAAPTPGKISAADFVARYANVRLEKGAPVKTEADVYGGEGYVIDAPFWRTVCSTGFGAYSAAGRPVVLTAGHCAEDGTAAVSGLEPATSSPAGGSLPLPGTLAPLGSFGFSQFGGPGNSAITGTEENPGNVGTDISVINVLAPGLSVQAAATKWDNLTSPGASAVKIIGKTAPFQGQAVCRSGRTTGWKCGTVDSVGIWVIPGPKSLPPNLDNDLRAVRAFDSTSVKSGGGDSGGPWISGNFALGTHTGAETQGTTQLRAIATTLEDALSRIPGVELQLFLNTPELVAPENRTFKVGEDIPGRVPAAPASAVAADSKVRITVDGQAPLEVPVDAAGNWTLPARVSTGQVNFSAETVNGFSRSDAGRFTINISDLDAPVITTPAEGAALPSLGRIDGTGTPGLTVNLSGDVNGSAAVAADGHWSIPVLGPVYGRISVHAAQGNPLHEDSSSVTRNFTVTPVAPAVASIVDGLHFSQDSLPATISGTGIDGADVAVLIDGTSVGAAQAGAGGAGAGARAVVRSMVPHVLVAGGRWSVPFPPGLAPGMHTLSVAQSVDSIASDALLVTFIIDAPVVAPAAPAAPVAPAVLPVVLPAGTGELPNTGAGWLLPAAGLAGASLALGGALLAGVKLAGARRRAVR